MTIVLVALLYGATFIITWTLLGLVHEAQRIASAPFVRSVGAGALAFLLTPFWAWGIIRSANWLGVSLPGGDVVFWLLVPFAAFGSLVYIARNYRRTETRSAYAALLPRRTPPTFESTAALRTWAQTHHLIAYLMQDGSAWVQDPAGRHRQRVRVKA